MRGFNCLLFCVALLGCDDEQPLELTVEQTLIVARANPNNGTGEKHHLFRRATPSANAQLVSHCREQGSSEDRIDSAPLVLGYTGGSAEALALIKIIAAMSDRYAKEPESFVSARDSRFLTTVFIGLGLMGERKIPEAQEFLTQAIEGKAPALRGLRWYGPDEQTEVTILGFALTAYAITHPDDLESKLASAKDRINRTYPEYNYRRDVESLRHYDSVIERLRRRSITDAEKRWITKRSD